MNNDGETMKNQKSKSDVTKSTVVKSKKEQTNSARTAVKAGPGVQPRRP